MFTKLKVSAKEEVKYLAKCSSYITWAPKQVFGDFIPRIIMNILLRHNKSQYSGKILYQEEQWHKRSFLWNIEEHQTSRGPFFERMNIKHTIYFGYLTQDGQEHQKRLMDFLFKLEKTHASKSILYILVNDCTKSECIVCKANNNMSWLCEVIHVRNIPHYSVDWY